MHPFISIPSPVSAGNKLSPSSGHCSIHLPFKALVILTVNPSVTVFFLFNCTKCATGGHLIGKLMFVLISLNDEEEFLLLSGCINCYNQPESSNFKAGNILYNYCGCSQSLHKLLISVYMPSSILSHKTAGCDTETTL